MSIDMYILMSLHVLIQVNKWLNEVTNKTDEELDEIEKECQEEDGC